MSLLGRYRAGKAIDDILAAPSPRSQEAVEAIARLRHIGSEAIPKLLEGLAAARATEALETTLGELLDAQTLPLVEQGLRDRRPAVADAVARVLATAKTYDPNSLLDLFRDPVVPKAPLARILLAHAGRLQAASVVRLLDRVESQTRPALLLLIGGVAHAGLVGELIRRLDSDDPVVRISLVRTLARFSTPEVQATLVRLLLADPHNEVRLAALEGLMTLELAPPLTPLVALLRDPDMQVQSKAIEALVKLGLPETTAALQDLVNDPKEGVRRAAVEVLNEIGTLEAVPLLASALRDGDWWVQVRATDALARIGGASVTEAVLPLVGASEEGVRRLALEVLERTKGEHTLSYLLDSLEDTDRGLRECAVTALATLGDSRAVPYLVPLLVRHPESAPLVVAALGDLGDTRAVEPLVASLETAEIAIQRQAVVALEKLASETCSDQVIEAIAHVLASTDDRELRSQAESAIERLEERFHGTRAVGRTPTPEPDDVVVDLSAIEPAPTIIDARTLRPGDLLADRYKVVRQVGKGGFGVVVLVEDRIVQDEIILKFLGPKFALDRAMIERFKHELRLARKITHQNVIRIYDLISFGHSFAISMEYFESHSLATELRTGQPVETGRGLKILRDIASGLAVAHRAGIIHRDLKPGNILINDQLEVKLVDFGLAAAASQPAGRLTRSGSLIGTPAYMSPEQIRDQKLDPRSDVYSLGIVMYEVLTGRPPYRNTDTMAVLFQHVEGRATPPRELNPALSPALEAVILKAMAVDLRERFQNAGELQTAIEALPELGGQ